LRRTDANHLIGVDEVGRGCLAGPVLACAFLAPRRLPACLAEVRDSKLLAPDRRRRIFRKLRERNRCFALARASPEEIDRLNILQATLLAMRRAVQRLLDTGCCRVDAGRRPESRIHSPASLLVVVDGNRAIPNLDVDQIPVVGADRKSFAVACASVVAKVARDRWMSLLDRRYPGYGLALNKGYGTTQHVQALDRLGPSPIHRRSFEPVRQMQLCL